MRSAYSFLVLAIVAALCPRAALAQEPAPAPAPGEAERAPESPPPEIVMPKLLHFEPAPYPEAAEAAGLEGKVVLKLTIDVSGNVTEATVIESAGHGFDEAAQAAALKFKFEPARRGDQPIAVQIPYPYRFTLAPETPSAPEPAPAATGELTGTLRIASTDTPLAGAQIVVTDEAGRVRRMQSDAEGRFQLPELAAGSYAVRVEAAGFETFEEIERVVPGEATDVVYRIPFQAGELEVIVTGERPPREVTRRSLERREIERIPGTGGDALRSIQSLPGVARPPGLAGLLIVRGSAPEDTATFIDGANVPIIYHFGGLASVVPTELLDRIDFYPGNFSARYGQVMGGIVDVALRAPETQCYENYGKRSERTGCFHGMAQVDLIDARLLLQGPIGKDWSFAIGGRRSWVDLWITPVLEATGAGVTSAPVYQDYQVIVHTRPTPDSSLRLQSYGSSDKLEILIRDPIAQDPAFGGNVSLSTSFTRVQALYQEQLTDELELEAMAAAGTTDFRFSIGPILFELSAYPVTLRSEYKYKLGPGATLNAGLDFLIVPFEARVRAPLPPRPGEPDPGPFAARPLLETRSASTVFRPGWYSELELTPSPRWRVVPSARVDYARDSGHTDFSPRLNARYDLFGGGADSGASPAAARRTTLKGGIGMFHQPPQFQETDEVFGTPGLRSNRALHYSLGVEQELTQQVEVTLEGYYKDMTNLIVRAPAQNGGFLYTNDGSGYSVGLETLLKYKPDEHFFGWISYTLSRSVRRDLPDEAEYLFQYDQTHNLIMLGSYRLGRGWEFGARFRIVSGPLSTPVVGPPSLPALYASDAGAYSPLQGRAFSRRLPLFHQLDLRIDKRWQFEDWLFSAYLDVQNAYNHQAVEALVYSYDYSQEAFQTGLPIIPSIGVRGEF